MPWVVERQCATGETLKLFMLDCTPLSCHEPWFAINAIDDDIDSGSGIVMMLPDAVVDRATAIGSAAGIEPIGTGRSITVIGFPTSENEFRALQRFLEVTYAVILEPGN